MNNSGHTTLPGAVAVHLQTNDVVVEREGEDLSAGLVLGMKRERPSRRQIEVRGIQSAEPICTAGHLPQRGQ